MDATSVARLGAWGADGAALLHGWEERRARWGEAVGRDCDLRVRRRGRELHAGVKEKTAAALRGGGRRRRRCVVEGEDDGGGGGAEPRIAARGVVQKASWRARVPNARARLAATWDEAGHRMMRG